jgi:hypothetical protein
MKPNGCKYMQLIGFSKLKAKKNWIYSSSEASARVSLHEYQYQHQDNAGNDEIHALPEGRSAWREHPKG